MDNVIDFSQRLVPSSEIAIIYLDTLVEYHECTDRRERRRLKRRLRIASDFIAEFDIPLFKEARDGRV